MSESVTSRMVSHLIQHLIACPSSTRSRWEETHVRLLEILRQSRYRRNVNMPGIDEVMQDGDYDDASVHGRRPVHRFRRHGRSDREESEDVGDDDVRESNQVESHAVASCGPAAGEQGLVAEALVEDAADAYDIWRHG